MHSLSNTQAIRAGAHIFSAAAQKMRENGHRLQLKATALVQGSDGWKGDGADAFLTVAEHLQADATLTAEAFGRASGVLMSLAGQLDEVNSLRHQAESLEGQIYALQREFGGADGAQQASIHEQLSHLRHRHTTLLHQADSLEYHANSTAATAFDEIGALANRLSFQHGQTAAALAMDKVSDFFGSLWKGAKEAVHKVEEVVDEKIEEFEDLLEDGIETVEDTVSGLASGIGHFLQDTVESVWEMSPAHFIVQLVTNYDEVRSKAARIFQVLQHPVDAIRRNLDELPGKVTVIGHAIVDSWNRDIVNGNAYTRSKSVGYALGMVALTVLTDGAGAVAGAESKVVGVETKVMQLTDEVAEVGTIETSVSAKYDYSAYFEEDLINFVDGEAELFSGTIQEDLYFLNYHSEVNLNEGRSLKWAVSSEQSSKFLSEAGVKNSSALLDEWGNRQYATVLRIPKGSEVTFYRGFAKAQRSRRTGQHVPGGGEQYRFKEIDSAWILQTWKINW
jgi:uncharacterized protein YukE